MGRLLGFQEAGLTVPEAEAIINSGDNGILSTFLLNPNTAIEGNLNFGVMDLAFEAGTTSRLIEIEGDYDQIVDTAKCLVFADIFLVVNSPAKSKESGSSGSSGYLVTEYLKINVQPQGSAISNRTVHQALMKVIANETGNLPSGQTILDADYGLTQGFRRRYWSPYPVYYHVYQGNGGAAQTFTLDNPPIAANGNALQIWFDGTAQVYTTDYTVDTGTGVVTFVGTDPAAGVKAIARVQYNPSC